MFALFNTWRRYEEDKNEVSDSPGLIKLIHKSETAGLDLFISKSRLKQ